jgi:hypothetical protein
MIRISCTSCKAILTVDDAFAGGVCRCQHCGTIQVVPANLKPTAKSAAPPSKPAPASKTASPTKPVAIRSAVAAQSIATATASLPQKNAPQEKSAAHLDGNLLKLGVVIAFILFLLLIALIFIFMREA